MSPGFVMFRLVMKAGKRVFCSMALLLDVSRLTSEIPVCRVGWDGRWTMGMPIGGTAPLDYTRKARDVHLVRFCQGDVQPQFLRRKSQPRNLSGSSADQISPQFLRICASLLHISPQIGAGERRAVGSCRNHTTQPSSTRRNSAAGLLGCWHDCCLTWRDCR